mgnify:CR=1 FL=1
MDYALKVPRKHWDYHNPTPSQYYAGYHAWFSASAAEQEPSPWTDDRGRLHWGPDRVFYTLTDGREVQVTCVTKDKDAYYNWPDRQYLGVIA